MASIPRFSELPKTGKTEERNTWGVFGADDQLGTINFLTAERVKQAAGLVRSGKVINLNLPLNYPMSFYEGPGRAGYKHHIDVTRGGRDDHLDNFALQGSTQWDSLRHVRFREYGYYGGRQEPDLDDKGELGIEHWARHGVVGRGILIDTPGYMKKQGKPLAPDKKFSIDGPLIERIAEAEKIKLQAGDMILLRGGWLTWYKGLNEADRAKLKGTVHPGEGGMECPGLDGSQATAAWLWDHHIAAIAGDNVAVEALPVDAKIGYQHRRLLPLLGMPLGELWDLDDLAADCEKDGVYEFLLVSGVLYLPGGVGSPANAYAIK